MPLNLDRTIAFAAGLISLAGAMLALPSPAHGQPARLGGEFQINTYATGTQDAPSVASDRDGNFIVVWVSVGQDGSSGGVFGQRYDAAGNALGAEFQVNSFTTGTQQEPSVTLHSQGNFVVVWRSDGQDGSSGGVFGQRYDASGTSLGSEFRVNTYTTGLQRLPDTASDDDGNFVVVWNNGPSNREEIRGQRFDAAGGALGGEFLVSTTTAIGYAPSVAAAASGDFVVAWTGSSPEDGWGILGRRFDSKGNPLGEQFQVNTSTEYTESNAAVASDLEGNFVVVWDGYNGYAQYFGGVDGQRFDNSGNRLGSEFQISSNGSAELAEVASDADGDFVVAWLKFPVTGRQFASNGEPRGGEFTIANGMLSRPAIASDARGNFVAIWVSGDGSGRGVFGQRFAGPELHLSVDGTCPGPVSVSILNAPSNSEVAVVAAANTNGFVKGGPLCHGVEFKVGEPFQLPPSFVIVDGEGSGSGELDLGTTDCFVQALALANCETSNAVRVP